MSILAFQRPDKVVMVESSDKLGKFEFRPLEPGYGTTIGNALRRILLSSLEGFAISSIKIDGVKHEFDTIPGVIEDVTNIILNLKQVRFKQEVAEIDSERATVKVSGSTGDAFTAGDLGSVLSGFKVLNPDFVICHLDPTAAFSLEFNIIKGRGYIPADEQEQENAPIDEIAIDSIFTPIINVKYAIENYRVEQKTDYEKLVLEITTDGSIAPKDALREAAKILIQHFMLFSDEKITVEETEGNDVEDFDENALHMRQLLKTKLTDLDLSVRALNCLKAADVETLGELCQFNRNDLLKFRNFGKKSLTELDDKLAELGLTFGIDTSKYKLDKD